MDSKVNFSGIFKTRMWLLSLVTGIIISITMPLTYFVLAVKDYRAEAKNECDQLVWKIHELLLENPDLWFYSSWKYLQIFTNQQTQNIVTLIIYNEKREPLHEVKVNPPSPFNICVETPLKFNNHIYGYIEISKKTDSIWLVSFFLLLGFSILGGITGMILYRYPLKIVSSAQSEINDTFEKLQKLSYWDPLTKLPNRIHLNKIIQSLINETGPSDSQFALIFLDIDRFKLINDNLGHSVGDQLLKAFSERIQSIISDDTIFSRVSGDEFAIIIPNSKTQEVVAAGEAILKALEEPFALDEHELYTTASIGICFYPDDARDIDSLFKLADLAMYCSKDKGKNRLTFTSMNIQEEARKKLKLENGLRKALKNGEIVPFYQPIMDTKTGTVKGFEALARWIHPTEGVILPAQFISVAEDTGLIIPLGFQILRQACEDLKKWHDLGYKVSVSVNISPKQFLQSNLITSIDSILCSTGIDPKYLQVEITESIAMGFEEDIVSIFNALHQKKIKILIDDFGTGYSSLKNLKDLSIDSLKIDQHFIRSIPAIQNNASIVLFMIHLAHNLGLRTVAEGVENQEQIKFLRENHCDELQGYYFAQALSFSESIQWLKERLKNPIQVD